MNVSAKNVWEIFIILAVSKLLQNLARRHFCRVFKKKAGKGPLWSAKEVEQEMNAFVESRLKIRFGKNEIVDEQGVDLLLKHLNLGNIVIEFRHSRLFLSVLVEKVFDVGAKEDLHVRRYLRFKNRTQAHSFC